MLQDRPITTARALWAGEYRKAWPHPLILWLRERSTGLALDWVCRVFGELLPRSGSPHATELLAELQGLRGWREAPLSVVELRQKARALESRPDGDEACDALSVLCSAVAKASLADAQLEYDWLWPAPSMICGTFYKGRPRPELFELCLASFEAFAAGVVRENAARGTS